LRIQQKNWKAPDLQDWSMSIEQQLLAERGPFVLAAHSFGCLASAQALARGTPEVVGALFVAPASPMRFHVSDKLYRRHLPVPSIVIGSENDPWMPLSETKALAYGWGASFINFGAAGHINVASGFGPWPRAKYLIDTLIHCAAPLYLAEEDFSLVGG
jgi:hypothetical protein